MARTSADGVELLDRYRDRLDHDLGGDDTIWPVVEVLKRAASDKHPFDVGVRPRDNVVTAHSSSRCWRRSASPGSAVAGPAPARTGFWQTRHTHRRPTQ